MIFVTFIFQCFAHCRDVPKEVEYVIDTENLCQFVLPNWLFWNSGLCRTLRNL